MTGGPLAFGAWLFTAFAVSFFGTRAFRGFAITRGLVANPNYRSLHLQPTASGGGVVFALVFVLLAFGLWAARSIDIALMSMIAIGGLVALSFGFADDALHLSQAKKLVTQAALAAWVMYWCEWRPLITVPGLSPSIALAVSVIALVWLMNLYNFVDGIDGFAGSGAVFVCVTGILALCLGTADRSLLVVFALLAACVAAFLCFNWPPATVFMGDAGSLFLGFAFGALIARSVTDGTISVWTWLIMFGYMAGDTSTTTMLRMIRVKHFNRPHRSHAYQNLARISGSHVRVVRGILVYQVLWLIPLAVWSILSPDAAWMATLLALGPVIAWTLKFGPLLSSD